MSRQFSEFGPGSGYDTSLMCIVRLIFDVKVRLNPLALSYFVTLCLQSDNQNIEQKLNKNPQQPIGSASGQETKLQRKEKFMNLISKYFVTTGDLQKNYSEKKSL